MAPPPTKKHKQRAAQKADASTEPSPKLAQVATLSRALSTAATTGGNLNPLADLVELVRSSAEPEVVHSGVYALGRVFSALIVAGKTDVAQRSDDHETVVRKWVTQRLDEYVDYCGSLFNDIEKDLRLAAFTNLTALLPLLAQLPASSSRPPSYPVVHLRQIVKFILFPTPSARGGEGEYAIATERAPDAADDDDSLEGETDVFEAMGKLMEDKRDIRWGVYREACILLRPYLPPQSLTPPSTLSTNVLSLLLTQSVFPPTQKALEAQAVLIPTLAKSPFGVLSSTGKVTDKSKSAAESDDWRDYFESDSEGEDEDEEEQGSGKKGKGKASKKGGKKPAGGKKATSDRVGGRASGMSIHQGVWSLESHRAGFTSAWMALLSLPMDESLAREILIGLHHQVLPNMTRGRAIRTADWLGEWVDRGGPLGLLALNGLFILIQDYNLDYPDFYHRLYAMLDRSVLHVKYRARFFRLSEVFLSSSHLPASLIASFIKRLARLSLSAPPAAIIMVIPFIYNLLKLHPSCMVLIHRSTFGGVEPSLNPTAEDLKDPYDPTATSPLESRALDSSLWEIAALQKHYLPSVSSLAKIFSEVFTKPRFGMEDFLDHTFVTLFETETKRKIRNDPALALVVPGVVFPAAAVVSKKRKSGEAAEDDEGVEEVLKRDIVSELWTF